MDKKAVFLDDRNKTRFVNALYVVNNFVEIPHHFDFKTMEPKKSLIKRKKPFVGIVAACLMPTHFHLFVTPISDSAGISGFLHKIGVSYTKYFNQKYERSGSLFEGTFKAKYIDRQEYAGYLTEYIHLNPLGEESKQSVVDIDELSKYRWSTLADYLGGKSNFSHVLDLSFRDKVLGFDAKGYKDFLLSC